MSDKETPVRIFGMLLAVLVAASPVLARQVDANTEGVTAPRVITSVPASYTPEAMRARVEGVVVLDAVVQDDGTVGDVTIVRSLDSTYGLDEQAIKALKQWKFEPGKRQGKAVAVRVRVEISFNLRSRDESKK